MSNDESKAGESVERPEDSIQAAAWVIPCEDLQGTLDFFRTALGFRLDSISPADDPREARMSGHGAQLILRKGSDEPPGTLRLACASAHVAALAERFPAAPNGTRIEWVSATPSLTVPAGQQEFVLSRLAGDAAWVTGRAGMRYRDLIPGRLGGRFIASHIHIPEGGLVPDSVHFHTVRFQLIYCAKGWVRVVYEDQGAPFVLQAGDAVLQPPGIRHRVLESSPGLEVVEVTCPAEHDTNLDHGLELPTKQENPERLYEGQSFVRHVAQSTPFAACELEAFECRDTRISEATAGLAGVRVLRPREGQPSSQALEHEGEFLFLYVLDGELSVTRKEADASCLGPGDSVVIPAGEPVVASHFGEELRLLEVRLSSLRAEAG